ncbi:MAG: flavohemoglobin expression-modulating QEGLA motif protein [Gammaproteobacteria bacterium]
MKKYHQTIKELSDKIVQAQRPIRILDALKWDPSIQEDFFKNQFKELPKINPDYYRKNSLRFDSDEKLSEFHEIERSIKKELGQFSSIGGIMLRMCREYCLVIELLKARGTKHFTAISQQLYGSSDDAFYAGAPTLKDLSVVVSNTLKFIQKQALSSEDKKQYSSEQAVVILKKRLGRYFRDKQNAVRVMLSDDIVADASAGAECIKVKRSAFFSKRDIKVLEVHEGWVHLGTTLNGVQQPICTFLSKGPPSSTITQEGLAIIMEIFTFASHPGRMRSLTDRITAVHMTENGANFLEVFEFFRTNGFTEEESYYRSMRVFRGSLPNAGPFTKDLVYNKGFILIYNYIRLAIQKGNLDRIPLLFLGKTTLEDLHIWADLLEEKIIVPPKHVPPQFSDLAALSSWMCYSLFLNQLDLKRLANEYKDIL